MADRRATCDLCREQVPAADILDHLRVLHPGVYGDGPATWPDGSPVVVDVTLEPGDFSAGT